MIDKEIFEAYIKSRAKIVADFKASLKKDDDDFKDKLLKSCPIAIGQIYERTVTRKTYMGERTETSKWKVTSLSPNVDGCISVAGVKTKLNGEFGKREFYMFTTSFGTDFAVDDHYKLITDESM